MGSRVFLVTMRDTDACNLPFEVADVAGNIMGYVTATFVDVAVTELPQGAVESPVVVMMPRADFMATANVIAGMNAPPDVFLRLLRSIVRDVAGDAARLAAGQSAVDSDGEAQGT